MAKKYYAVKTGKKPGIYNTWDECKEQVNGVSGATYKSFTNYEEAQQFMEGTVLSKTVSESSKLPATHKNMPLLKIKSPGQDLPGMITEVNAIAYVDGSYNRLRKEFSYGMVILKDDKEITDSQRFKDEELAKMHNVAGEIKGAEAAMKYALDHHFQSIVIYHDYEGIAKWCLGEWKAKQEGTKAYKSYFDYVSQFVQVSFVKVDAHTGDYYNDMADQLAKQALGLL